MRRTYGYLAKKILIAYNEENTAKHKFWRMAEKAEAAGNKESEKIYTKIGNDHAARASVLLSIIIEEKIATEEEIIDIDVKNMYAAKS